MITRDFSVISMTSQASLSLSLLLTKVTHAQYRKRFRASYNTSSSNAPCVLHVDLTDASFQIRYIDHAPCSLQLVIWAPRKFTTPAHAMIFFSTSVLRASSSMLMARSRSSQARLRSCGCLYTFRCLMSKTDFTHEQIASATAFCPNRLSVYHNHIITSPFSDQE